MVRTVADLIAGAIALYVGIAQLVSAVRTRRWSAVRGKLVSAGLQEKWEYVGREKAKVYEPAVVYSYVVGGRTYEGRRIALADRYWQWQRLARRALRRLRGGGDV